MVDERKLNNIKFSEKSVEFLILSKAITKKYQPGWNGIFFITY